VLGKRVQCRLPTVLLVVATVALVSGLMLALYLESVSVSLMHKWRSDDVE
jgi:hypothetical protein